MGKEEMKDIITAHIKRDVLLSTLNSGKRYDGRDLEEMRKIEIQRDVINTAEGSALVRVGDTQVLVATKFDIVKPFSDRPKEGVMVTNGELLPIASPTFEPGPPDEYSIEMARVVDRAIRSAECIDLKSFYVQEEKVLGLYLDIYVLNHAGNYTDTATIAATAALMNTKIPKIEDGAIIRGEYNGLLQLTSLPTTTTLTKIGDYWLVDPTRDEELVGETFITIGTTEEHVCTVQKGKGWLYKEELMNNIDIAFKRGNDIRSMLSSN